MPIIADGSSRMWWQSYRACLQLHSMELKIPCDDFCALQIVWPKNHLLKCFSLKINYQYLRLLRRDFLPLHTNKSSSTITYKPSTSNDGIPGGRFQEDSVTRVAFPRCPRHRASARAIRDPFLRSKTILAPLDDRFHTPHIYGPHHA